MKPTNSIPLLGLFALLLDGVPAARAGGLPELTTIETGRLPDTGIVEPIEINPQFPQPPGGVPEVSLPGPIDGGGILDPPTWPPIPLNELSAPVMLEHASIWASNINLRNENVLGRVTLDAPTSGRVLVQFNGMSFSSPGDLILLGACNTTHLPHDDGHVRVEAVDNDVNRNSFSHTRCYDIEAGRHTYYALGENWVRRNGTGIASIYGALTVKFFPDRSTPNAVEPFVIHRRIRTTRQDYSGTDHVVSTISLHAPAPGRVVVRFDGQCWLDVGARITLAASETRYWDVNSAHTSLRAVNDNLDERSFSHTRCYKVGAGNHSYYAVAETNTDYGFDVESPRASIYGSLTVEYFPDAPVDTLAPTAQLTSVEKTRLHVEGNPVTVASIVCNAIAPGKVVVTFDAYCNSSPGDRIYLAASHRRDYRWGPASVSVEAIPHPYSGSSCSGNNISHTRVYDVEAGSRTFYAVVENSGEIEGDGQVSVYGHLTVEYFPDPLEACLHQWAERLGMSNFDPAGDEDGDGITNQLELAFGGHGGDCSLEIAPGVPLLPEVDIVGGRLAVRYLIREGSLEGLFDYDLQFSQDTVHWLNANTPGEGWTRISRDIRTLGHYFAPDGGILRRMEFRVDRPIRFLGSNGKRSFARVKVTPN